MGALRVPRVGQEEGDLSEVTCVPCFPPTLLQVLGLSLKLLLRASFWGTGVIKEASAQGFCLEWGHPMRGPGEHLLSEGQRASGKRRNFPSLPPPILGTLLEGAVVAASDLPPHFCQSISQTRAASLGNL